MMSRLLTCASLLLIASQNLPTANATKNVIVVDSEASVSMGSASLHSSSSHRALDKSGHVCDSTTLEFLEDLRRKYPHQPTFLQAVEEMARSVSDLLDDPFYRRCFEIMTEPERTISFRVPWTDDQGHMRYNRGWRVEFSRYVRECQVPGVSCWSLSHFFCVLILSSFALLASSVSWGLTREDCASTPPSMRVCSSSWALSRSSRTR